MDNCIVIIFCNCVQNVCLVTGHILYIYIFVHGHWQLTLPTCQYIVWVWVWVWLSTQIQSRLWMWHDKDIYNTCGLSKLSAILYSQCLLSYQTRTMDAYQGRTYLLHTLLNMCLSLDSLVWWIIDECWNVVCVLKCQTLSRDFCKPIMFLLLMFPNCLRTKCQPRMNMILMRRKQNGKKWLTVRIK